MTFASLSRSKPITPAPTRSAKGKYRHAKPVVGPGSGFIGSAPRLAAVAFPHPPGIQTKLTVGEPNDKYEQEADRVADQVMRMPDPRSASAIPLEGLAAPDGIRRVCAECEEELRRQPVEDEEEELQMQRASGAMPEIGPGLQAQIAGLRGGGQPLPPSLREFFEPRFGHDFGPVRMHTDRQAADAARALNARAFTVDQHVVFGAGQYAPQQVEGQRLLAHELAHVLQQRSEATGSRRAVAGAAIQRTGGDETSASDEVAFEEPAAVKAVRYPYTRHCGVVDWSHAGEEMASLAKNLVDTVRWASDAFDKYEIDASGAIRFGGQTVTMATDEYYVSPVLQLDRKLTEQEIEGVALTVFMVLSVLFEQLQGTGWVSQATSFSGEDLPSNLIGFYHGLRGYNRADIERICEVMPEEEVQSSFKIGGKDISLWMENNRAFRPTQYPPGGSWPAEFNTVQPIAPSSQVWDLVGITLRWEELGIKGMVSKQAYLTGQQLMSQCRFANNQVLCR